MIYTLDFEYDGRIDLVTIEGIKYSGELFRAFAVGGLAVGEHLKIIEREDGVITLQRITDDRS